MDRATKIAKIKAIRTSALLAVKERGKWKGAGYNRLCIADIGDVEIGYRTPFQRLPAESDLLRYQRSLVACTVLVSDAR